MLLKSSNVKIPSRKNVLESYCSSWCFLDFLLVKCSLEREYKHSALQKITWCFRNKLFILVDAESSIQLPLLEWVKHKKHRWRSERNSYSFSFWLRYIHFIPWERKEEEKRMKIIIAYLLCRWFKGILSFQRNWKNNSLSTREFGDNAVGKASHRRGSRGLGKLVKRKQVISANWIGGCSYRENKKNIWVC